MASLTLNIQSIEQGILTYTVNSGKKLYVKQPKNGVFKHDGIAFQYNHSTRSINEILDQAISTNAPKPLESEFSINQRFEFLEKFTGMVLDKITASALVTGEGGLGKSHVVKSQLDIRGLVEDTDYVMIKGYATPKALYKTLSDNRNKLIIFDDCDSVLRDPISLNLLKGALDSYDKRTISWLQNGFMPSDLPSSFDFEGNVIFISNLPASKIDQAVKSRSITIDLTMSLKDKIERMETILPNIASEFDMDLKYTVLNFMKKHAHIAVEFNMRTLITAIKVAHSYNLEDGWEDAVKYLLTND